MIAQASRRPAEIVIVYLAGLAQGLGLVTFPAASNIFKSAEFHHLTSSEYGTLFVPMILCAIVASGVGGALAHRLGLKQLFLLGLTSNFLSMSLLALSNGFVGQHSLAYGLLLLAMAVLGAGFGVTLTSLNTYAMAFFPSRPSAALASLHAVLGIGTALAPLLLAVFAGMGWWWGLPVGIGLLFMILTVTSAGYPLEVTHPAKEERHAGLISLLRALPARFWIFSGIVLLYGTCETIFGNWATIYLHEDKGLSLQEAGFALAAFWAMVTVGRVVVAAASIWLSAWRIYPALPVMILGAFLSIPAIGGAMGNVVAFGFAGLACSAFLPLSISFAEQEFSEMAEVVSGGLIAAYMLGYGMGSFGVGPLRETGGLALSTIYTASSALAVIMVLLAFFLTRGRRTA